MDDLMTQVTQFTESKRAAQKRYLDLIAGLSDEQIAAVVTAATPEVSAEVDRLNNKAMGEMEKHPLAEHLAKALEGDIADSFKTLRDKVWELVGRDNRRNNAALSVFTAPQVVLMFGEYLSDDERNAVLAPWRAALGDAAGL